MTAYTDQAIALLKEKGLRITRPRKLVLDLLDQTESALSAYEIKDALDAQGEKIDTVSVYRILECLDEHGLIHRVLSSGKVRKCLLEPETQCQLEQPEHCHHLLICTHCHRIQEIHCPGIHTLIRQLKKQIRFTIESHHLEFTGLCEQCEQSVPKASPKHTH